MVYAERSAAELNPDKSEALVFWLVKQLEVATSSVKSVQTVTGVDLPVAEEMKVLRVALDRSLTFEKHGSAVARSCNYHVQTIYDYVKPVQDRLL